MTCFHPLNAWQHRKAGGKPIFNPPKMADAFLYEPIKLACGSCIGCRVMQRDAMAARIMNEASLYKVNCVLTLTYAPENLPRRCTLVKSHPRKFIKRLRKRFAWDREGHCNCVIRFSGCGEYGEAMDRPHYHVIIFNWEPPDKVVYKDANNGSRLWTSKVLEELWGLGFVVVGEVNAETAAYIAGYCTKKITGKKAEEYYRRVDSEGEYYLQPEFSFMSTHPGIGAGWFNKYVDDIYPHDYEVLRGGRKIRPPRYYDKCFKRLRGADALEAIKDRRKLKALEHPEEVTPRRLADREVCARARQQLKTRVF